MSQTVYRVMTPSGEDILTYDWERETMAGELPPRRIGNFFKSAWFAEEFITKHLRYTILEVSE